MLFSFYKSAIFLMGPASRRDFFPDPKKNDVLSKPQKM
jgi:hypothetical protein